MKNKVLPPQNYPLYESAYGSDTPFQQLYLITFGTLPSKFSPRIEYDEQIIDFLYSNGFIDLIRNETSNRFYKLSTKLIKDPNFIKSLGLSIQTDERIIVNNNLKIIVKLNIKYDERGKTISADFLYDITNGPLFEQLQILKLINYIKERKKSNINLIKSDMGHLDIEEYELNVPEINLELNYGKNFLKINDLILKRLNTENDKGIILLHGDPGTGKTSYIKYLTKNVTDKEILFIPPSMAETLSEPSIIPFLMEHKNSILIIEDAERVISDRETNGSSAGVSNILNLTDGILGDCLGIQIIATFNMRREKIDTALLRKGRLIVEHKFTALSVDETNKLLNFLGKKFKSEQEMCLADIYNVDTETYKVENKNSKIGF